MYTFWVFYKVNEGYQATITMAFSLFFSPSNNVSFILYNSGL